MRKLGLLLVAASSIVASAALGQSSPEERAVVLIRAGVTNPANQVKQPYPPGSGFLISLQGHIITARHVVLKDDTDFGRPGRWVSVSLGHGEAHGVSAGIVHCELGDIDLCLLKLRSSAPIAQANITSALTPSCRHLQRGERIVAMGYITPTGFRRVRGEIIGEQGAELKYPSDVPIAPGMSGGPVLDQTGRVVAANFGALEHHPTHTYLQALIEGKGLFERAGVACTPVPPPPPAAPPCDGVEVAVGSAGEQRCIRPGSGKSFRDCPECPEMVVVPAGSFMMGSTPDEIAAFQKESGSDYYYKDEGPQRDVTIARPFALGKFEVTFAEWDACVADGGCTHRPSDEGWGRGRRPVINVSWDSITKEYLPWLSRKTGKIYRLPSEAEWEYAARARTKTLYNFGNSDTELCAYANGADRTLGEKLGKAIGNCRDGHPHTAPVGSFRPNGFGLYDTHGNVQERVQDCRNDSYSGAPSDGSAWTTGDCGNRVMRGGSWDWHPRSLRISLRNWSPLGYGGNSVGFRVARTL